MQNLLVGIRQKKEDHFLLDGLSKSSGGDRKDIIDFRDIKKTELIRFSDYRYREESRLTLGILALATGGTRWWCQSLKYRVQELKFIRRER